MSSSGVYSASIRKVTTTGGPEGKESHVSQRLVIRRYDLKDNELPEQVAERRGHDKFNDNPTKILLFKELSSMDEDELCGQGHRRDIHSVIPGLRKKMKLSEESNDGIAESLENFCEMHRRMRQPVTPELGKMPKPQLQPTVERGLRNHQRPMTASKLAEIAVTKYPDSIFKVYIPEGNRAIKQKRVVPIADIKPCARPRTPKLATYKVIPLPDTDSPDIIQLENALKTRSDLPPQKTKLSVPRQNSQPEKCSSEAAGESSAQNIHSPLNPHVPKRMTLITDISLTKEQEVRRLKERAVMRKRTMNAVKKIFPAANLEEDSVDSHLEENQNDTDLSGDENSGVSQRKGTSISKSSLKSATSLSSSGHALSSKKSVTWKEDLSVSSVNEERIMGPKKKKKPNRCQVQDSSRIGKFNSKSQRLIRSASEAGNSKCVRCPSRSFTSKRRDTCKRSEISERKNSHRYCDDCSYDVDRHKCKPAHSRLFSRESMSKKKQLNQRKGSRIKRCECGKSLEKREVDLPIKVKSGDRSLSRNKKRTNICNAKGKDQRLRSGERNGCTEKDNFQNKRNAIIRKHNSQKNIFENGNKSSSTSICEQGTTNEEQTVYSKTGQPSSPSTVRKSSIEDSLCGSSDSEYPIRGNGGSDVLGRKQEPIFKNITTNNEYGDKPLMKIFETGNIANQQASKELVPSLKTPEDVDQSDNFPSPEPLQSNGAGELNEEETVTDFENNISRMKEECFQNSKSMGSLVRVRSDQKANQSIKKSTSSCLPLKIPEQLDRSYLLVESYSALTDTGHRGVSNSNSSIMGESQLSREPPMINITAEERLGKSDELLNLITENLETAVERKLNDVLLAKNSQQCKITPKITNDFRDRKEIPIDFKGSPKNVPDSTLRNRTSVERPLKSAGIGSNNSRPVGAPKPSKKRVPSSAPGKMKSSTYQHQDNRVIANQEPIDRVSIFPCLPKTLEERKIHLKKMLARRGSSDGSTVANQILEIWNSTQKSITARKEKMLASLRVSREGDSVVERKKSLIVSNPSTPRLIEKQSVGNILPITPSRSDRISVQSDEDFLDSRNGEDESFQSENFQDVIVHPGSRTPQPYSSTHILNNLSVEGQLNLDNTLLPYSNDCEPEKPLCETVDFRCEIRHSENNSIVEADNERTFSSIIPEIDVEDVPERDVNTTASETLHHTQRGSSEFFSSAQNSTLDVANVTISSPDNVSRMETNVSSTPRSLSVEAMYSDESEATVTGQTWAATSSLSRKVSVTRNLGAVKTSSKSPGVSRSVSKSRGSSRSRERSASRRIKASSSGISRRNVLLLERPPSRKPHMIATSEDDSDQEFMFPSQPSSMNIYADQLLSTGQNNLETQKKPPPRMYSTLKDTPHAVQESLKSAIRDMHKLKDEDGSNFASVNERPVSRGPRISREGGNDNSSRPSSQMYRSTAYIPKMSAGSVRILQEKASSAGKNKKASILDGRDGNLNSCVRNTRRQELHEGKFSSTEDRNSNKPSPKNSPENSSAPGKPPFRHYSCKKSEDQNSTKLKLTTTPRNLPNYLPPWERVNLTPPESALKERALHEKRLGIVSKVAGTNLDSAKPKDAHQLSKPQGNSRFPTSRGSESPGSSAGSRTPVDYRTPVGSPVRNRAPVWNGTPTAARRKQLETQTAVDSQPMSLRRSPNLLTQVSKVYPEYDESPPHSVSYEQCTDDSNETDADSFHSLSVCSGGCLDRCDSEDSSRRCEIFPSMKDNCCFSSNEETLSTSSLAIHSSDSEDRTLSNLVKREVRRFCNHKTKRRKSIEFKISKTSVTSGISISSNRC